MAHKRDEIHRALRTLAPSEVDQLAIELIMAIEERCAAGYAGSQLLHIQTKLDQLLEPIHAV